MRFFKRGKRHKEGAVDAAVIIGVLLAIVGFIIVLFFFSEFDFSSYSEDELCKLSVLSRASSPANVQSAIPLKCTTKKICLSKNEDCKRNFAGEKIEKVDVSGSEDAIAKQIAKTSADAMLDCWKIMGEGKLDLFGSFWTQSGWSESKPTCVICSRIAVDESVSKDILEKVDINKYMRDNVIPELGVNYISAFTGGGAISYVSADPAKENAFKEFAEKNTNVVLSESRENRELAIVFMQFRPPKVEDVLKTMTYIGGTVAGLTFISPISSAVKPIVMNPVGGGIVAAGVLAAGGYGMWNALQGQLAVPGYCGKFVSNRKNIEGCSMVQGINYNARDFNLLCPQVEGNL